MDTSQSYGVHQHGVSFLPGNLPDKKQEASPAPVQVQPTAPRRRNERGARIDEIEDAYFEKQRGFSKLAKRRAREQRS